jgi:hypothetical protein
MRLRLCIRMCRAFFHFSKNNKLRILEMKEYTPIADSVFDQPDDQFLFESVFHHLLQLFDNVYPSPQSIESRTDIPASAKVAWYLWQFAMDVSSSGIPDYLLNHCPSVKQMMLTHRALKTVQAVELLVLLEAAIPFVNEISKPYGEFSAFPLHEWFDQFQINPLWTDLEQISEPSWKLAAEPLTKSVAAYLRSHRSEF